MKIDSPARPGCHWSPPNKCLISPAFIRGTTLFYACGVKGWGLVGWIRLYCPSLTACALSLREKHTFFFTSHARLFSSVCYRGASARVQREWYFKAAAIAAALQRECRSVWTVAMTSDCLNSKVWLSGSGKGYVRRRYTQINESWSKTQKQTPVEDSPLICPLVDVD